MLFTEPVIPFSDFSDTVVGQIFEIAADWETTKNTIREKAVLGEVNAQVTEDGEILLSFSQWCTFLSTYNGLSQLIKHLKGEEDA